MAQNRQAKTLGVVALIFSLITILALSIRAWRMGRKIAKLQHEKDVAEEKKIQAEADKKVAELEEKKQKTEQEIKSAQVLIDISNHRLKEAKAKREETIRRIQNATTWEDLP